MKHCPQCNHIETDEALKFCRVDGATLIRNSSSIASEAGTAQLSSSIGVSEGDTNLLPNNTSANVKRVTGPTTALPLAEPASATHRLSESGRRKVAITIAISILVIAIAIVSYFVVGKFSASRTDKGIESVAVLPFENKSGNADSDYLSDGLAESLIYRLSQLSNLKVSPRSSAFRYKGQSIDTEKIGNELGVDAVMSGRLTQRGDDCSSASI